MKYNKITLSIVIVILTLVSCKTTPDETYGDWRAVHLFYNGEELLDNDFELNGWYVQLYRSKVFYIDRVSRQWVLYMYGNDEEPERGYFRTLKDIDSLDFEIYNSNDSRFNGLYSRQIEIDTVWQDGFRVAYYYLILESKEIKIMAIRNKALPFSNSE